MQTIIKSGYKDDIKTTLQAESAAVKTNIQDIVNYIKGKNTNTKIYVTNQYNPYKGISIGDIALGDFFESALTDTNGFNSCLNTLTDCNVVDIYTVFNTANTAPGTVINATTTNLDFHPNKAGHHLYADTLSDIKKDSSLFALTVTNGTGGGNYTHGTQVTIKANAPVNGKQFKEWTGVDGLKFADGTSKTSETAKFKMPDKPVTVTATYKNIALTGTAKITGTAKYGEALIASLEDTNNTGILSYQWKCDGIIIGTGKTYEIKKSDIQGTITVEITSNVETGTIVSNATATVEKADGQTAPDKPLLINKSYNSISVATVTGQEYKLGDGTWQDSGIFAGLTETTTYSVITRIKETDTTNASAESLSLAVTTDSKPIPQLTGTAKITGTAKYGEVLIASLEDTNNTGILSYQWKCDGIIIGTGKTYEIKKCDI